ncbi:MAG TPA: YceI family protein [Candidatus Binataceae bacterium]|nr:YceI family protein [Candidatus Binataceae bacterium]
MGQIVSSWYSRIAAALLVFGVLASTDVAHGDIWKIDPMHTAVSFRVRHMTISNVTGKFDKVSGTMSINGTSMASLVVDATVDASSIDTGVAMRDADLKGPHFLDVEKYPTITFKSTKVMKASERMWRIEGDLTLHGVTKPVSFFIDGPTGIIKDPKGNERVGANATATISRKDFGLTYNPMLEAGGAVVGDAVSISLEVEAVKQK